MGDPLLELRKIYGRLKGIERATAMAVQHGYVVRSVARDYDLLLSEMEKITNEDTRDLSSNHVRSWGDASPGGREYVDTMGFAAKLQQTLGLLEAGYNVSDKVIEIGSLYNSIKDEELRARCGDLLTATDHFDRVVNQATQVLEMRIRRKAGLSNSDIGADLVNKAINADPAKTIIQISDIRSEQEGFANICRGVMQALRNETHHRAGEFSREDSFAVCGFIDRLIRIIDQAVAKRS